MFKKIRWPGILTITLTIVAVVAILASAAYDRMPAEDSPPHVKAVEWYGGRNATFYTNFRLYNNCASWPLAVEKELRKIDGVVGVTILNPFCLVIAIAKPFADGKVPERAKHVIQGFAPPAEDRKDS